MTEAFDPDVPWWLPGNFAPVTQEVEAFALPVTGELPAALTGLYVRNGSNARQADNGHWFLGEGMLHGVRIDEGRAAWYRNRWIHTGLYRSGAGFAEAGAPGGATTYSNVSAFIHAGRLLTSGEIGHPYEIDPEDLSTVGLHDYAGRLTTSMTAHPKLDPDTGHLHFFGYGFAEPYLTYHVADERGRLISSQPVDVAGPTMVHDFAVTDRDVVFWEFPVVFDLEMAMAGEGLPFRWDASYGARIGVLPLGGPASEARWVEVPPASVFHGVNAYREGDDVVVDCSSSPPCSSVGPSARRGPCTAGRSARAAVPSASTTRSSTTGGRWTSPPGTPAGSVVATATPTWWSPRRSRTGWSSPGSSAATSTPGRPSTSTPAPAGRRTRGSSSPTRTAPTRTTAGCSPTSTTPPRRAVNWWSLDAADISAGAVATVALPARVPHGFHAAWVPAH